MSFEYKSFEEYKQKTGLQGIESIEFLLDEIKKLKEGRKYDDTKRGSSL